MQNFLDVNFTVAQKSLDAVWTRQKVISGNLANIDTPGYKSYKVEFEDILKGVISSSAVGSNRMQAKINALEPKISQNLSSQMREDGNNVDVDAENIELTRAQMQYEYMIRSISSEISRMKYVISGGR